MDAKDRIIEEQQTLIKEQQVLIEELRREIEELPGRRSSSNSHRVCPKYQAADVVNQGAQIEH